MRKLWLTVYTAIFWSAVSFSRAQLISVGGGGSQDAVSKGFADFVQKNIWHYICAGVRWLGGVCVQVLFKIYGWLGTRLLFIPDFSNNTTYSHIGAAVSMVTNLVHIMQWLGFILLVVLFMLYIGRMALGLNNQTFTILTFGRLIVPTILLFAWPTIVSLASQISTNLSFYIYHQNLFNTQNVLEGLNNLDANQQMSSAIGGASQYNKGMVIYEANLLKAFAFSLATFLCVVGMMVGWSRIKSGKEGGLATVATAGVCLMVVFFSPALISYFANTLQLQNFTNNTSIQSRNLVPQQGGNFILPSEQTPANTVIAPTGPTTGNDLNQPPAGSQNVDPQDTIENVIGSLIKVFVSLWGIFICIGVLIAKAYQVFSIFILFFLGFPLIGLLANPSTESATQQGLKLFLKLHLYGPVWALALLAMNVVIFVDWGPEGGSGAGSIMTAFMILAGLSIIQNTQDFANIFSVAQWGSGGGAHGFMRDAMSVVKTGSMAAAGASSFLPQKVSGMGTGVMGAGGGAIMGAAMGALAGPAGILSGAMTGASRGYAGGKAFGEHTMKSVHAVSNTIGGNDRSGINAYAKEISGPLGKSASKVLNYVSNANKATTNNLKDAFNKIKAGPQGGNQSGKTS